MSASEFEARVDETLDSSGDAEESPRGKEAPSRAIRPHSTREYARPILDDAKRGASPQTQISKRRPASARIHRPVTHTVSNPAFGDRQPVTTRSNRPWSWDDFTVKDYLGSGRFGRVFSAKENSTGYEVALKVLEKREIVKVGAEMQVRREIEIQSELNHPNILRLFGFFYDSDRICLILEFARGGELHKRAYECKHHLSEAEVARYTYQLASALRHCHAKNIIHRDLKPENILFGSSGRLKIADFGWAVHTVSTSRRTTMCGTLDFLAPELCEKRPEYDKTVDVWSLGIVVYELLYGQAPFAAEGRPETMDRIRTAPLEFLDSVRHVSVEAKNLISGLLQRDPAKRARLKDVLYHPWIKRHVRNGRRTKPRAAPLRELA